MVEKLKVAWRAPKPTDFSLRQFALGVLEIARENLQNDRELVPAAFAITESEIQCYAIPFADHTEKPAVYIRLVEAAKENNALALVTCNDAFWSDRAEAGFVEGYYPGKLAAEKAKECIMLTVSGPAIQTWSAEIPYDRVGDAIEFGMVREESGGQLGLLEGWASETPKLQ